MTLTLSIIAPTYCERSNIRPFVEAVSGVLTAGEWELIFVDDDSPDGTADEIAAVAREGAPVRCIRRVGRRGLASAVVEGVMSASGDLVAVMDADMQHDESLLPRMQTLLTTSDVDVVVASRHIDGGGLGDWSKNRRRMSAVAAWASRVLIGNSVSDPMSGFFMTRRRVFDDAIYDLAQQGYKILLDILTSSSEPLKIIELPYVFRERRSGSSKVDAMIIIEYAFLLIEKLTRGFVPPRYVLFAAVGAGGLVVHLSTLKLIDSIGFNLLPAQGVATVCAMTFNYISNNLITYRTDRLRGGGLIFGYVIFCLVCSVGALANISVANLTMRGLHSRPLAGIAGAVMSSVFNFGVVTRFVWGRQRRRRPPRAGEAFDDPLTVLQIMPLAGSSRLGDHPAPLG